MENLLQPVFEPADFVPERGSAAFFRDAAGRGSPAALSNLGVLYARGEGGVEKDGAEALKCFREAAGKNYPAGVLNLGIFLLTGPLESRDEHEAEKILTVEAEKGSPAAQCALGLLYSGRLYPAAADQESSLEWLRKSSAQGFPEADYLLALDSLEGRGVREDRSTAFALMGRAASSGVVAAQYRIGIFFRDGTGTAADFRNAAKWLERAALRGSPEAAAGLGNLYETGRGVQRDNQQAVMWYKKAEKIDPALGGYFLARMYEEGRG
ncbi:MAG: sel1 repeat family protein, partial [Succinivibrionaceae bacterium]|nr:sel1 repeat family protein [Succinivibrionaceae bacterium]